MNISDIMSKNVQTITSKETVNAAHRKMKEGEFRHLPVMDGRNLVGMISNRDLAIVAIPDNDNICKIADDLLVKDIMTPNPVILSPMDPIKHAMEIAIEKKFGAFPVMEQGSLVGIVTTIDLLKACVEALERGDIRM